MKRRDFLKSVTGLTAAAAFPAPAVWSPAKAQSRQETLLIVSESGPNNLDIHGVGTNVPGYEVSWNCYDRLISHEMKTNGQGTPYYDKTKFKPELAEDMNTGDMSVTFKLRKDAVFQDGAPVTAKDVKWSFDRAVTVGGFPTFQMSAGSLTKPEQFVTVDDHTFRVDFQKKDHLTIPDLAVIVPCILNSELVKSKATEQDPWGLEFTKLNTVGSGAYKVTNWTAGSQVVLERNDNWKGGPLPKVKRIIWRMVPDAGNRRALLERGDADVSYDLPNKDFSELKADGKLSIVSTPYSNGIQYIGMNVAHPPFDNVKVRYAIAYAIPYQKIMDAVMYGLAKPMFGASGEAPTEVAWPQPHKFNTDLAKAKALLAEAGYPNGLPEPISDVIRSRLRRRQRTDLRADAGKPGADRHPDHHQQSPGRQLAHRTHQKEHAAIHQCVLGLARLPGILLLLVLSLRQIDLQHHGLPVAADGHLHRRRAQCRRDRRHGKLRHRREGLCRPRLYRHAAHPALSALRQCRDAKEHHRLPVLVPSPARLPQLRERVSFHVVMPGHDDRK